MYKSMNNKKLLISFFIMILVLTGCTDKKAPVEVDDAISAASGQASSDSFNSADYEEDDNMAGPKEGTSAYELDWIEIAYNGISLYIPSEWELVDYEDADMVRYQDTQSPDCIVLAYYNDPDISKEQREDAVLFGNALIDRGYMRQGTKKGVPAVNGSNIVFKAIGTLYIEEDPYQALMYYYPVGDYGIVEALFMHANDVDNKSDRSCLEMAISTMEVDDESVPEDSKDLGIQDLGTLPVILLDNDEMTLTVTGVVEDRLTVSIANKTDEELNLSLDAMSVNGYDVDGTWIYDFDGYEFDSSLYTVDAGSEDEIYLTARDLDTYNIKELGRVGVMFNYYGPDYKTRFRSDYLLLDTVDDYKQEDYVSYEPSDDVVYEDDKMIITYEGVKDGTACFMVQSLTNERFDVSGSKVSIDGEYKDNMSSATVYPGNMCMMAIDDVEVESGMTMMISFSIKDSNGSRYSTDTYSVDL